MKTIYTLLLTLFVQHAVWAQQNLEPTISPGLFRYNDPITVQFDVTGTPLANLSTAYAWVWIPGKNIDAKYNVNPANSNATLTDNAKFTKSTANGNTFFTITFTPSDFFASSIANEKQLGILLKGNDWSNGQTKDFVAQIWDGSFQLKLVSPTQQPLFVVPQQIIEITAEVPVAATFKLFINEVLVDEKPNLKNYTYNHTVQEVSGSGTIRLTATTGTNTAETEFQYLLKGTSPLQARPVGVIPGINYNTDNTSVTLCLLAPEKSSVYVTGDFSDWKIIPENIMKKDGAYFWIKLSGLSSGQEYGYQYLIDESIFVADPYADKILDPDDQYIPSTTYPGLKPYPAKALSDKWYFNRVAVFQTGQQPYNWAVPTFDQPAKEKLVIYELLLRDFFGDGEKNYQNLIDTVSYLKNLGINTIELMPIMEFNGNESWGYNPTFMFAPDKFYGSKNDFKAFIDHCHQQGIAVVLDITMNHHDIPNPYLMMDFDFGTFKPTASNKWFNVNATHPFNVFFDMNHESSFTQAYLDTVNHYWLNEYKVDGFRFDLSKGFTQVNSGGNVGTWSNYDPSRVALLKRMADKIWAHSPEAYVILEHFADNQEEKELAEYKADEGKGMMLWGNLSHAYSQNAMGYAEESNINGVYHGSRNWTTPHLIGYMESHDEERMMFKNLEFGNQTSTYSTKDSNTALERMKAAAVIFYTVPGPKMLWQFGELGYDESINLCPDGTINNDCRVSPKPVVWNYLNEPPRKKLQQHVADLLKLRNTYDIFSSGDAVFSGGASLSKQLTLRNKPYTATPANATQMNVQIVINFDVVAKDISVVFPHTGSWFDYYSNGEAIEVTLSTFNISLAPGEYKLFTDVQIETPVITAVEEIPFSGMLLYPNPVYNYLKLDGGNRDITTVQVRNLQGQAIQISKIGEHTWDVSLLSHGLYILEVGTGKQVERLKFVKR